MKLPGTLPSISRYISQGGQRRCRSRASRTWPGPPGLDILALSALISAGSFPHAADQQPIAERSQESARVPSICRPPGSSLTATPVISAESYRVGRTAPGDWPFADSTPLGVNQPGCSGPLPHWDVLLVASHRRLLAMRVSYNGQAGETKANSMAAGSGS